MGAMMFDKMELGSQWLTGKCGGELLCQTRPFPFIAPTAPEKPRIGTAGQRVSDLAPTMGTWEGIDGDVI